MEAILKFDLNNSEDMLSYKQCTKANDMAIVLWEWSNNFKRKLEAELNEKNIDGYEALYLAFEKFHELLDEYKIDVDDLCV